MSKKQGLRDIDEKKCLMVAKADLQRSTFRLVARPIFRLVRAAEVGIFAVNAGKAVARHMKR